MAKVTIDPTWFRKTKNGFVFKQSRTISKQKFENDPRFQRNRDNAAEFGTAGKAVKLIREAFSEQIRYAKDSKLTSRLQKIVLQALKADPGAARGHRRFEQGELSLLNGFEFNAIAPLTAIIPSKIETTFDSVTGEVSIIIPDPVPNALAGTPKTMRYELICAAAEIDFVQGTFNTVETKLGSLTIKNRVLGGVRMSAALSPASDKIVMVLCGIRSFELLNGAEFPHEKQNALAIVKVFRP